MEELKDKFIEENEASKKKRKTDPPLDRNTIQVRLPEDLIHKLFKKKLSENQFRNKGYIIDGYPKYYSDAHEIFYDIDKTKPDDHPDRLVLNKELLPNNIIKIVNVPDDFLKNRVKNIPELHLNGSTRYNDETMNRRLNVYKTLNESSKGDPSVTEFFSERKIKVLDVDGKISDKDAVENIKIFLERVK